MPDFEQKFTTTADVSGAKAATAATNAAAAATKAAGAASEAAAPEHAHNAHETMATRQASMAAQQAMWSWAAVMRGDFARAMHEAKHAVIDLQAAMTTIGPAALGIAAASLALSALPHLYEALKGKANDAGDATGKIGDNAETGAQKVKAAMDISDKAVSAFADSISRAKTEAQLLRKAEDDLADALTAEKLEGIEGKVQSGAMSEGEGNIAKARIRADADRSKDQAKIEALGTESDINFQAFQRLESQKRLRRQSEKAEGAANEAEENDARVLREGGVRNERMHEIAGTLRERANKAKEGLMSEQDIAAEEKKLSEEQAANNRAVAALRAKQRTAETKGTAEEDKAVNEIAKEARAKALKATKEEHRDTEKGTKEAERDFDEMGKAMFKGVHAQGVKDAARDKRLNKIDNDERSEGKQLGQEGQELAKTLHRAKGAIGKSADNLAESGLTTAMDEFVTALENLHGKDAKSHASEIKSLAARIKRLESKSDNARTNASEGGSL